MARVVGIIAEYNPFHNGHLYHLKKVKEFMKNKELLCILKNIKNETDDIDKILFKFYQIYSNCYKDSFEEEFTIKEILILQKLLKISIMIWTVY